MNDIPADADGLKTILGGVEIEVEHFDQEKEKETIKVRQIPLRHMPKYASAMGDEGLLIELFTNKPADWADGLTQESQEKIVEVGDQLNLDPFLRWSTRRLAATKRLEPLADTASGLLKSVPPSAPGVRSV